MRKEKLEELNRYIDEVKTVRKEFVNGTSDFIKVEKYDCFLNNGKVISRDKILKNNKDGSAVIVLAVTKDKEVILTVQPRVFTKRTVGVGLVAGYVEDGEDYIDALKRELLEESGYTSNNIIELCSYYQDDGCSEAFNRGYIAFDCEKVSEQSLDKDEYIKSFLCTIDELFELDDMGYILDCGTKLIIEKAKNFLNK